MNTRQTGQRDPERSKVTGHFISVTLSVVDGFEVSGEGQQDLGKDEQETKKN